jgi:ribonucleotide reductase beta subunit family protein with ferritin-like domain
MEWTNKYIRSTGKDYFGTYDYPLAANMLLEQIFLPICFTFISWTATESAGDIYKKKINGFCQANKFIVIDENMHSVFARMLMKQFQELRPPRSVMLSRTLEFLDVCDKFVDHLLDGGMPGMTPSVLKNVARHKANELFEDVYSEDDSPFKVEDLPNYATDNNHTLKESAFETVAVRYPGAKWEDTNEDMEDF